MNIDTKNKEVPERALELLPWFITGQLSSEDEAYFKEALQKYSSLESLVEEERNVFDLVTEEKSLIGLSTFASADSRLENVLTRIDETSETKADKLNSITSSHSNGNQNFIEQLKNQISSWFPSSFGVTDYTRFASVALLVISLSVLMAFIAPLFTEDNEFIPAASKTVNINSQSTTVLLVGTNGSIDSLQNHPLLMGKLKKVESVPGKKGMYQISLNMKLDNIQVKEMLTSLSSNKELIWFAGEAY